MRRGSLLIAIAIALAAAMLPAASRAAQTPGIATDPILQPPYENGEPLDIKIGLHIVNISSIDEVNEQFQMDAYLFAQWIDPRLAYTQEGSSDHHRHYALGQIWVPQLEMINAATPRTRFDTVRFGSHPTARSATRSDAR